VQNQLAQVGVDVVPQQYQGNEFDTNLTKGNFDLVTFGWGGTTTPLSSAVGIYASPLGDNPRQNFGRVASPPDRRAVPTGHGRAGRHQNAPRSATRPTG